MKRVLIALIRFYQKNISSKTPPCCRFIPTCSQYAVTAIERFGAIRGTGMAIWRILRCGPWSPGGYDPVPERKSKKKKCCSIKHEDELVINNKDTDISESSFSGVDNVKDNSATEKE